MKIPGVWLRVFTIKTTDTLLPKHMCVYIHQQSLGISYIQTEIHTSPHVEGPSCMSKYLMAGMCPGCLSQTGSILECAWTEELWKLLRMEPLRTLGV